MARKIPAAVNSAEMKEILTDRASLALLLKDQDELFNWTEDTFKARLEKDPDILAQVNQQAEKFHLDWLRDAVKKDDMEPLLRKLNLHDPNSRAPVTGNRRIYNPRAIGAVNDQHGSRNEFFASMSDFLYGLSDKSMKTPDLERRIQVLKNDLSSVKPSDGGFLIPEILRTELLRVAIEGSIVRSRARVIPMDSLTVPFPTVDSTSNVSSVYGGVTGFWTEEGATLTESQPRFGRVELRANKLTLYTEIPNELMQDANMALMMFIQDIFPEALRFFEDIACFIGGGVGEPLGWINSPCRVLATRTGGGAAVEWADIVNMYSRMLPQSLDRAVWVISQTVLPSLLTMTLPGNVPPVIIGGGGFPSGSGKPVMSMLGIPIIVSEKARAAGTTGDIGLCDFGYYLFGDRQAMSARQSEEFGFNRDVTCFRVIERVDGRTWLRSPITPQNGSSETLSPFVLLT